MSIEKSIRYAYAKGSGKPEQPRHEKLNGNVISIFPIPHEKPWYEDMPPVENGDDKVERSTPPSPYGTETFGWQEYEDYLEKVRPGAIPLSFPKFMDQLDMRPEDYWSKLQRRKKQGVMKVVAEPMAWQKKYLLNFYPKKYLDSLGRDDLEKLFDEFLLHRATRGRA